MHVLKGIFFIGGFLFWLFKYSFTELRFLSSDSLSLLSSQVSSRRAAEMDKMPHCDPRAPQTPSWLWMGHSMLSAMGLANVFPVSPRFGLLFG